MSITLHDRAPISGTHRTADGYLAAEARIARTGIQIYAGREVGRPDLSMVRVFRGEDAVFAGDALASIAHKPLTLDHPNGAVSAERWKELAVGWTGDTVARDGEFVRVSMMVADAAAIAAIENGTRELSCGYSCSLDWTPAKTPAGETYDARQVGLRINHVAIVPKGRAGSEVRIGDAVLGDASIDIAWQAYLAAELPNPADRDPLKVEAAWKVFVAQHFRAVGAEGLGAAQEKEKAVQQDAQVEYEITRARTQHRNKFAWMGDSAPAFDEAAARLIATSKVESQWGRQVRDAAYAESTIADARSAYQDFRDRRREDMRDAWRGASAGCSAADMRDLARSSQYR